MRKNSGHSLSWRRSPAEQQGDSSADLRVLGFTLPVAGEPCRRFSAFIQVAIFIRSSSAVL